MQGNIPQVLQNTSYKKYVGFQGRWICPKGLLEVP